MTPDDPRHGKNAGFLAHWKDGEDPCEPCRIARTRASKASRLDAERGRPRMVLLGDRAHHIVVTSPRDQLARAVGVTVAKLCLFDRTGPSKRVHRATRDRILAAGAVQFWTPIGIQRRIRGLNALGWSMEALAADAGVWVAPLRVLLHKENPRFVRRDFAEKILAAYERNSMTVPTGRGATRARNDAARKGWVTPLTWTNIDDPSEDPAATAAADLELQRWVDWWADRGFVDDESIDEVKIRRVLAGEVHDCTPLERRVVLERAHAYGRSLADIERQMGWKADRYFKAGAAA